MISIQCYYQSSHFGHCFCQQILSFNVAQSVHAAVRNCIQTQCCQVVAMFPLHDQSYQDNFFFLKFNIACIKTKLKSTFKLEFLL